MLGAGISHGTGILTMTGTILVRAEWDPEAGVYTATSEDVPGLVAEAATLEALETKLQTLIPELLELNADIPPKGRTTNQDWTDVPMVLISQHVSKVRIHA
jgi:predicted RNase H-like HicB family nuclease